MKAGIALGSNLGDRGQFIERGFAFLQELSSGDHFLKSSIFETKPVDCPLGSPAFLNAAAEIEWERSPLELLRSIQSFEQRLGRPKIHSLNSPRPLDLDIIYLGDQRVNLPGLVIPHPRAPEREFVLRPLSELCPDRILPGQTSTILELVSLL